MLWDTPGYYFHRNLADWQFVSYIFISTTFIGGRYDHVHRQIALMQVFSWNDEVIMDRGVSRRLRRACFLFHTLLSEEVYFKVLICSGLTNAAHIRLV